MDSGNDSMLSDTPDQPPYFRQKLDPRLSLLLSLPIDRLRQLKALEDGQLARLAEERQSARDAVEESDDVEPDEATARRVGRVQRQFAPLTTGVYISGDGIREESWPVHMNQPFVAAFILSEAGAGDLTERGVHVRSQAGDVFSAFIPFSAIRALEASAAVRYIELARPLFPSLDVAVPFAGLTALHTSVPSPITGAGVIVGVFDSLLDIYHPDFRDSSGGSRVRFLWDQTKNPMPGEASPPPLPEFPPPLPGFPSGSGLYGIESDQARINLELTTAAPRYTIVRHGGIPCEHGTHVTGIAAGNGRARHTDGLSGRFLGGAPAADIIFVAWRSLQNTGLLADTTEMADAFAYIFARAALLGQPCVVNMSNSDDQGPHDGTSVGEQFLDNLLLTPGRAITLAAGNSNVAQSHASGQVPAGGIAELRLKYIAGAKFSDVIEIWYDGIDRYSVTVTVPTDPSRPTDPPTVIGPVSPGVEWPEETLPNGVGVKVTSVLNDPRNGDNLISLIFLVPSPKTIPPGDVVIALAGDMVINGTFHAWVDRNNRGQSEFLPPHEMRDTLTLGVPATARRAITVGNHTRPPGAGPGGAPTIFGTSGRGPSRDGRIKPEIATVGTAVMAARSRNMNDLNPGDFYRSGTGTSQAAPLVAGACACLFECRGASATWASLKQILEDTAGTSGAGTVPNNAFGFGYLQISAGCSVPLPTVDVWLKNDETDPGLEPFTGPVAWLSPDIEVLDSGGNPTPNPTWNPAVRFSNIIRVTVRNRGTRTARNTEVHLCWADPATHIPYPSAWNSTGFFNDEPGFVNQSNTIVIPRLPAGGSKTVLFAWAPPAPGSSLRGDDHFCLLVRLENLSDPSLVGDGRWSSVTARNNIGLRNVHVQSDSLSPAAMSFLVTGSDDVDSLFVVPDVPAARVSLLVPIQALPWRDMTLIEKNEGTRPWYGCCDGFDPLSQEKLIIAAGRIREVTDIVGADLLELSGGIARITFRPVQRPQPELTRHPQQAAADLLVPHLRIMPGSRMSVRVEVHGAKPDGCRRFLHIGQRSGGQLVGGVSLELRKTGA